MKDRLLHLLKTHAYEKKEVTLASGKKSDFYIDVKRVSLMAEGCFLSGSLLYELIIKNFPKASAVGGMTLGADPLVSSVAACSFQKEKALDAFIIRKEAKDYGLNKWIEGGDHLPAHCPVVIVEDVVTSGGSSLKAIERAREKKWQVLGVLAIVDREEGGAEAISAHASLPLVSLFKKTDFFS